MDRLSKHWQALKRAIRLQYLRIMRQAASPHCIAMGLAVGIFVGFLPIIPFQLVTAFALAFLLKGNKIAALAGTWVSNPVNMIPFYTMLYFVGELFCDTDITLDYHHLDIEHMIEQGIELVAVMSLGGVILGLPAAFITYVITFRGVQAYRRRRMIALLRKHAQNQEIR